jgi:hypothetical protein
MAWPAETRGFTSAAAFAFGHALGPLWIEAGSRPPPYEPCVDATKERDGRTTSCGYFMVKCGAQTSRVSYDDEQNPRRVTHCELACVA